MQSEFLIVSAAVLTGFILLAVVVFRLVARGKIMMSPGAALVALLVAILLVPFAMNLSAHFLSNKLHETSAPESTAEAREAR
jgi:Zn-dependent protease with chaperone function